ncbi:hypothetical protein GX50_02475 [[Emmonsia] crescens]|uniref:Uncharacterized protein n=1 Tax=[Emmonsia] crescens TaxID=73230 RepID=A0A2B7ZPH4_9EURO|nr:hypothetical protein GX50_02475 [Emmonsia crescens]
MDKLWRYYPKIQPIRPLKSGECFLVQYRDKGKKELWIGVICSEEMISDEVWRHCPVGSPPKAGQWMTELDRRNYPVYLPRKRRVIWANFIHLFQIHRPSYDEFESCPDYSDFCQVLNWALKDEDVMFWERMALGEFKERQEMMRLTTAPAGNVQPRSTTGNANANQKTTEQTRLSPAHSNAGEESHSQSQENIRKPVAQSSCDIVAQAAQVAKIADSQESIHRKEPLQGRVDVYIGIGKNRKIHNMPRQCLPKSGLLENSLKARNQTIIASNPILDSTSHADFAVVLSFLEIGEYTPQLIASRKNHHHLEKKLTPTPNRGITFYLEGLITQEEHEKEVLRCGYIYMLAQTFEIPALQALVLRKLRLGFPVTSYRVMLMLVAYVFPRLDANFTAEPGSPLGMGTTTAAPQGSLAQHYVKEVEPLRAYLVEWLVVHMATASRAEGSLYWETVCKFEGLKKTVLMRAAEVEIDGRGKYAAGTMMI